MLPCHLTFNEGNNFCGNPFMASCLFPGIVEPVVFGSLGGQNLLLKELGSFMWGWGGGELYLEVHLFTIKLLTLPYL